MNKNIRTSIVAIASMILFSACGGGSSENSTAVTTVTGTFVDDPVQGMDYNCSSGLSGKTNSAGEYTCTIGDTVTFYIGTLKIGSAPARSEMITPYTIYPSNTAALNLARLLQTLNTGSVNGILELDSNQITNIPSDTNFASSTFTTDVETALAITLVTAEQAKSTMDAAIVKAGTTVPPRFYVKTSVSIDTDGNGTANEITTYTYDSYGFQASGKFDSNADGIIDEIYTFTTINFSYDSKQLNQVIGVDQNATGTIDYTETLTVTFFLTIRELFSKHVNGEVITNAIASSNNQNNMDANDQYIATYTKIINNKSTESYSYYSEYDARRVSYVNTRTHDSKGRIIENISKEEGVITRTETFTYNSNNDILEETIIYPTISTPITTTHTYVYDINNNILTDTAVTQIPNTTTFTDANGITTTTTSTIPSVTITTNTWQ